MSSLSLVRFMVNAALPTIDGYVRAMKSYSVRRNLSKEDAHEFADRAAARFVDLIIEVNLIDETRLKQKLSIEVKKAIIKILNESKG